MANTRKTKKTVRAKSTVARKGATVGKTPKMAEFSVGIQKVLPKGQYNNLTTIAQKAGFASVELYASKLLGAHSRIIA